MSKTQNKIKLDKEEKWYEKHSEEFVPVNDIEEMRKNLIDAAKESPKIFYENQENKKSITLRLSGTDIDAIKVDAMEQGLPYQSLIASIIHKYLSGHFIDKDEAS